MRSTISCILKRLILVILWLVLFIPILLLGEKSNLSKHFKLLKIKLLGKE